MADAHGLTADAAGDLFGAIETGGTKFVCAVGRADGTILRTAEFPTETPEVTLANTATFLSDAAAELGDLAAIGIGSFGPVQLDRRAANWGSITNTPKPGWQDTPVADYLARRFLCPIGFDTDVNAAALGEAWLGAASDVASVAYITVGTGIGVGLLCDGRLIHGLLHPEAGHFRPRRALDDTEFPGICPVHRDCLEGLASGTALLARTQGGIAQVPDDDPLWRLEAFYIAQLCAVLVLVASPERIVIGGGVLHRAGLLPLIREELMAQLNGYIADPALGAGIEQYVVAPGLPGRSAIIGALKLAAAARDAQA